MHPVLVDWLSLASVLLLILLNAYFVAAEYALITIRWTRVEELVEQGKFGAQAVRRAIEHLDSAIAATQLGITFASLALGWLGEPALAHRLQPLFAHLPGPWDAAATHAVAVVVAYLMLTYLHVVLGEQAPKALAIQRSEDVALIATGPLITFGRVFRPLINAIRHSSNLVIRLLRVQEMPAHQAAHSVDELQMLVEETEEAGVIPADQATYVQNVFELSSKCVRDVMIPRDKVITLSLKASPDEVLDVARQTAHTRMPVWDGDPDNIVGIVNTKNLFHLFSLDGAVIMMDAMYEPIFVPADMTVARLLRLFKRVRRPMAIVQDADRKFLGVVTLEDVLEEIVGEIEDEHDAPHAPAPDVAGEPESSRTPEPKGAEPGARTRPLASGADPASRPVHTPKSPREPGTTRPG